MITDLGLRLATAEVTPNGGSAPGGLGPASVTLGLEPGGLTTALRSFASIGSGEQVVVAINIDTAFESDTFNSTMEFQLISLPIVATKLTNATTSGRTLTITGVTTNSTTDELTGGTGGGTLTGHELPLGTPLFLTSLATTTGIANSTIYYAVPVSANAIKLATSLANALAGTTIDLLTGNGTATVNIIPTIHASTGGLPMFSAGVPAQQGPLRLGQRIFVPLRQLWGRTPRQRLPTGQTISQPLGAGPTSGLVAANAQRFFYLRYLPSAGINTGAVTCDIVLKEAGDSLAFYPTMFEVIG